MLALGITVWMVKSIGLRFLLYVAVAFILVIVLMLIIILLNPVKEYEHETPND